MSGLGQRHRGCFGSRLGLGSNVLEWFRAAGMRSMKQVKLKGIVVTSKSLASKSLSTIASSMTFVREEMPIAIAAAKENGSAC